MALLPAWAPVRCVLFDLDGTLIDSAPDLALAADAMRTARGMLSLPLEVYRPHASSGARGMLAIAFGIGPDAPDYQALREEFLDHYARRLLHCTQAFEGVAALLATLQARGVPWGVVTNKARRFTEPLVAGLPLLQGAAVVISGDSTPHTKPHPEPVLAALRLAGVEAHASLYVGDDERDIAAGRTAGVRTVAAGYGYLGAQANPHAWGADAVIGQPGELLKLLDPA